MEKIQSFNGDAPASEKWPVFRKLVASDAADLAEIESMCFTLPWSAEQCAKALEQKCFAAFGLWEDGRLLAYISFYQMEGIMEIINLAVRPECRRLGYGNHLLGLVLRAAGKIGMQRVVLETREHNIPAISLYKKNGFSQCGVRPRYYGDSGEAALIFEIIFTNS